jgi:hypothetical protein
MAFEPLQGVRYTKITEQRTQNALAFVPFVPKEDILNFFLFPYTMIQP